MRRLPLLAREGYGGPIICTEATRDLSGPMLADAAHIQEQDADHLSRHHKEHADPLYATRDAIRAVELMRGVRYDTPTPVVPGVTATFVDAGHILGSASVIVDCVDGGATRRLVFSGDMKGRLYAYDADTGKEMWRFNMGSGCRGGIISYEAHGQQYILAPSGLGSAVPAIVAGILPEIKDFPGGATLFAFKVSD